MRLCVKFRIQNFYSWTDIFNNKRRSDYFPLDDWFPTFDKLKRGVIFEENLFWRKKKKEKNVCLLYYNDGHRDIQVLLMSDFQCRLFVMLRYVAFNIVPDKTATKKQDFSTQHFRKFWGNKRNHLKLESKTKINLKQTQDFFFFYRQTLSRLHVFFEDESSGLSVGNF